MRLLFLAAAIAFSAQAFATVRAGVTYQGSQDGNVCYFKIASRLDNLTFQADGDYVNLGASGVQTSDNTVKFEGVVYYDYDTSDYVPYESNHPGAQYRFTVLIEFSQNGETLNATVTREKLSGLPAFSHTAVCENIGIQGW